MPDSARNRRSPAILAERRFLIFAGGQGVSAVGDGIYLVALAWTALALTHSAVYLGLLLATTALPRAVLMLAGGVVVDRWGARMVILGSDLSRALLISALAVLVLVGHASIALLFVIAGIFGVFDALFYPATMSIIPALVDREHLSAANGTWQVAVQGSLIVGPPLGGVLVGLNGAGAAFAADGASFLVAFVALLAIGLGGRRSFAGEPGAVQAETRTRIWTQLTAGVRAAVADPFLRALLPVAALVNMAAGGPLNVGLPLLARVHHWGPDGYGALFGGIGAGLLLGGLVMGTGLRLPRISVSVVLMVVTMGVLMAVLGFEASLALDVLLCVGIGTLISVTNVAIISLIQSTTSPQLLGRVSSVVMFSSMSLTPVSYALSGAVARLLSPGGLFFAGAAMVVAVALIALSSKAIRQGAASVAPSS